jgi:hypothetical protein
LLGILPLSTCAFISGEGAASVEVRLEPNQVIGQSFLATGATHMEYSLDPDGDPAALAQGRRVLAQATSYQNQHIMGLTIRKPGIGRAWTIGCN